MLTHTEFKNEPFVDCLHKLPIFTLNIHKKVHCLVIARFSSWRQC